MYDCTDGHCLICSDAVHPARVLQVNIQSGLALVEREGRQEEVDTSLVEEVVPGDMLLVHVGVALAREAAEQGIESQRKDQVHF